MEAEEYFNIANDALASVLWSLLTDEKGQIIKMLAAFKCIINQKMTWLGRGPKLNTSNAQHSLLLGL